MDRALTIRILVVGDDNVGKTTLIQALCGASSYTIGKSSAGCGVSVRVTEDQHVQEFYDIAGADRYRYGRQVFYSHRQFDGVLFVYDLTDANTRSSVSCVWVPEVMTYLGDVGSVEAGGRLDGNEVHVRSTGVINELRFLWRQALLSHSTVSPLEALREALRLSWRLARLWLNEVGIWNDFSIDREAERLFLSTSTVPTAILGMKADLVDRDDLLDGERETSRRSIPHFRLHANSAAYDSRLQAFFKRVADSVKRKTPVPPQQLVPRTGPSHVALGFS